MKRKGLNFKHAPHLTWRPWNPDLDRTLDGVRECSSGYSAIISVQACGPDVFSDDPRKVRAAIDRTPSIPVVHSRTNMAYGAWRKQSRGRYFWVRTKPQILTPAEYKAAEAAGDDNPEGWEQQWKQPYWTCPVYWVENGWVYTSTSYTYEDPNGKETRQ